MCLCDGFDEGQAEAEAAILVGPAQPDEAVEDPRLRLTPMPDPRSVTRYGNLTVHRGHRQDDRRSRGLCRMALLTSSSSANRSWVGSRRAETGASRPSTTADSSTTNSTPPASPGGRPASRPPAGSPVLARAPARAVGRRHVEAGQLVYHGSEVSRGLRIAATPQQQLRVAEAIVSGGQDVRDVLDQLALPLQQGQIVFGDPAESVPDRPPRGGLPRHDHEHDAHQRELGELIGCLPAIDNVLARAMPVRKITVTSATAVPVTSTPASRT